VGILLKKIYSSLTRKERLTLLIAAGFFLASALSLGIFLIRKYTVPAPSSGGTFTEGVVGQPTVLNPITAKKDDDISRSLIRLTFSNLAEMADKVEVDESQDRAWRVRLKENLLWHDGAKITSDDVIFTIQKIQSPETQSPLAPDWQGITISRLSELEMQFTLPSPYAFFRENLGNLYIIPKHLFADVPPSNWHLSEYNLKPIGSGPYQFASRDIRSDGFIAGYDFKANPSYFGQKPYIQNFNVRFFAKTDDLLKSFNSGQIEGWMNMEPEYAKKILRPYDSTAFTLPGYYAVFLNQSKNEALKDASVREALALSVNKEKMVKEIFGEQASPSSGPIPPGTSLYASSSKAYDPETAVRKLESAGWKLNEEGVRVKTSGKTSTSLEFSITVPTVPFLAKTAQDLKSDWEKLGAKVTLESQPSEEIAGNAIKNRDYEMLLFGNALDSDFDLFPFWHSSQRFSPGLNLSLYNSKKADSLMESVRQNFNETLRMEQFAQLQKTIEDDVPAIFLYSPSYSYITSPSAKGIRQELLEEPADHLSQASLWYMRTTRVLK
jgi:peptide/nickel transport system substrate-binding protein